MSSSLAFLRTGIAGVATMALALSSPMLHAQSEAVAGSATARAVITQKIVPATRVALDGNVRRDLPAHTDLGPVDGSLQMNHVYLVLQRSPEQQGDLENFLERVQQPGAEEYHHWLTPEQFGRRFGMASADVEKITDWLESQGITVNSVDHAAKFVDIALSADQARKVFGTQLHYFDVNGKKRFANLTSPMIPAALKGVVVAMHGLNDFPLHMNHTTPQQVSAQDGHWKTVATTGSKPVSLGAQFTTSDSNGTEWAVAPQDFWTIYNVNPIYSGGTKGANATIAVAEESDIVYGTVNSSSHVATGGDVETFRKLFGVDTEGSLNMLVYHGYGKNTCTAPGIDPDGIGEDIEASLDAEWASALAPAAKLIYMSCDQSPDDGIVTSLEALIDNNLADAISLSYGETELAFTSTDYAPWDALWMQAAAQGQSMIVSSGDSGSDVADQNTNYVAVYGLNVSAFSASPYVTAAGGTDFQDVYDYTIANNYTFPTALSYWNNTNNSYLASAKSYVPETTWNDTCASSIVANFEGLANSLGNLTPAEFCAYGDLAAGDVVGGSGGLSTHYSLPNYQKGITGLPSTTFRAQPDIAFFASNGFWNHYLVYCDSTYSNPNVSPGDVVCDNSNDIGGAGGTSFVAPQLAGIAGLLVSYTGERQGLLNPTIYALAKSQFTGSNKAACYANGQTSNIGVTTKLPATSCIFNDVTTSNNSAACDPNDPNCYSINPAQDFGALSTSATTEKDAYNATVGYDLVTGVGSANINNLFTNWKTAGTTATALSSSASSITSSQSVTLTAKVTGTIPNQESGSANPTATGTVSFKDTTSNSTLGTCTLSGGSCTLSVPGSSLKSGANAITASYGGSKTYPTSTSSTVTVTVGGTSNVNTTTTVTASPANPVTIGTTVTLTASVSASSGTPTGTVTFYANGTQLGTGTLSSGKATYKWTTTGKSAGTYTIDAVYAGTTGFNGSTSSNISVTLAVPSVSTTTTLTSSPANPITIGSTVTLTATVKAGSGTPTGTVTFYANGEALGTVTLSSGKAVLAGSSTGEPAGSYSAYAVYNGATGFNTSTSPSITVTLAAPKATPTVTLTSSATSVTPPASLTLTATVSGSSGTPTGTVTFYANGESVASINLSGGKAVLTASSSGYPAGTYPIKAVFNGNSTYSSATSNTLSITVK